LAGEFVEPPGLRHFAWTSMLTPRRAIDEQHTTGTGVVAMKCLCHAYTLARVKPIHREVIAWVGEFGTCLACHWSLSAMGVVRPGRQRRRSVQDRPVVALN